MEVLALPATSSTRTIIVLELVSVTPDSEKVVLPVVAVAVCQVAPLSSDTRTMSPVASAAPSVPVIVWAAVAVMKSVALVPVSAENATVETASVGAVVSSVNAKVPDTGEVVPVESVCLAITDLAPSPVREKLVPVPVVHVAPPSMLYCQAAPLTRPPTLTVPLLVILSVADVPESEASVSVGAPSVTVKLLAVSTAWLPRTANLTAAAAPVPSES